MILIITVQQYFLLFLLLLFNSRANELCSVVMCWIQPIFITSIIQFFFMSYSYLKQMKHFKILVSVSKASYRIKVAIVNLLPKKTLWLWLSHLTWSLVGKALEKFCQWLLFCSVILKVVFQQVDFCVIAWCTLGQCAYSLAQKSAYVQNSACCKAAWIQAGFILLFCNHYDVVRTIWNNRHSSGSWKFSADLSSSPPLLIDKVCQEIWKFFIDGSLLISCPAS